MLVFVCENAPTTCPSLQLVQNARYAGNRFSEEIGSNLNIKRKMVFVDFISSYDIVQLCEGY